MLAGAAVVTGGGAASTARASAGIATLRIVRVTTGRVTTGRATTEARNRADQRKAAPVTSDVSFRRGDADQRTQNSFAGLFLADPPGRSTIPSNAQTSAAFRALDPTDSLHPFVKSWSPAFSP